MYNVDKLEQKWKRYRRKKLIIPIISGFVASGFMVALSYVVSNESYVLDDNESILLTNESVDKKSVYKSPEKNSTIGKISNLETTAPSLGDDQTQKHPKIGQIIFQDSDSTTEVKVKKRKNLLIQVTERGGKDIAVDIENRFEFAEDKSDSLFLAKYYYDKMQYAKAKKWALETNKLDNTIEESWLIFAKSQAKQGKRVDALKVLKAFSSQNGSTKARILMDKIRRGKSF